MTSGRCALALIGLILVVVPPLAGQEVAERETLRPFGEGNLPFFYDLYTFRGADGGTDVVAAFAVPAGELAARRRDDLVRYRFDVSLVLADTARGTVTRSDDSVYVAATGRLDGEHLLFTHVGLRAEPNVRTVHRVVMTDASTPGVGQLYDAPFVVPDYRGDTLMLSDIALGQPRAQSGWRRGEAVLALFPTEWFPETEFDVYYEIYNLPYDHRYTTHVRIEAAESGEGSGRRARIEPVTLRFDARSDALRDGVVRELRQVAGSFPPGRYRLIIAVTDEDTGATARRSRHFRVRGWAPGATLVVARPRTEPGAR